MIKLLRLEGMKDTLGLSRATIYSRINDGLLPKPVRYGERISVWPSNEVEEVTKATIAGKSDDEIRAIVANLHEQRQIAA